MLSRYLTRVSLDGAINELWKVERVALRTNDKIGVSHLFFILMVHFTNCQHQQKKYLRNQYPFLSILLTISRGATVACIEFYLKNACQ